ncbi:c-type cytochrome [Advenella sp. WQ 585]|uniref:C-type cytochrome n=1 Tax=Advenella mandrilli TaxID=2800330 RepID=A0ABS1EGX2_9BURK|nr:c-type cytochrome [Advenella mandrilli]MBK1782282.1 c-type cytochrome [Advenella mandrilli]
MLRSVGIGGLCLSVFLASAVYAEPKLDGEKLVQEKICLGCHQLEAARVGPPFRAIAERYKDASDEIVTYLAQSIRTGGRGRWGVIPMPVQPQVNEEQAEAIARWIRSLN